MAPSVTQLREAADGIPLRPMSPFPGSPACHRHHGRLPWLAIELVVSLSVVEAETNNCNAEYTHTAT